MPGELDGLEATIEIRQREKDFGSPRVYIVGCTGNASKEDEKECKTSGMDGHLVKPINRAKLEMIIAKWKATLPDESGGGMARKSLNAEDIRVDMPRKSMSQRESPRSGLSGRSSLASGKSGGGMARARNSPRMARARASPAGMTGRSPRVQGSPRGADSPRRGGMKIRVTKTKDTEAADAKPDSGLIPILYVDDNALNRKVVKRMSKKLGYECDLAENGKLGVDAYKHGFHQLVLMDCHMPVMDGFESAKRIGEKSKHSVPIVALTAMSFEECQVQITEVGMIDYLGKPVTESKLKSILEINIKGGSVARS
eukprot:953888_1